MKKAGIIIVLVFKVFFCFSNNESGVTPLRNTPSWKYHKEQLEKGVSHWNKFRRENPESLLICYFGFVNMNFRDYDFSNIILKEIALYGSDFTDADFTNSTIIKMTIIAPFAAKNKKFPVFNRTKFNNTKFLECELVFPMFFNTTFRSCKIEKTRFFAIAEGYIKFIDCKISNSNIAFYAETFKRRRIRAHNQKTKRVLFHKTLLNKVAIRSLRYKDHIFNEVKGINVEFSHSDQERIVFKNSVFDNALFFKVVFKSVRAQNTYFIKSNFKKSKINGVFTNCYFIGCDFRGAAFSGATFKGCDFRGAKIDRKWYNYIKRQGVSNFDKIVWVASAR